MFGSYIPFLVHPPPEVTHLAKNFFSEPVLLLAEKLHGLRAACWHGAGDNDSALVKRHHESGE